MTRFFLLLTLLTFGCTSPLFPKRGITFTGVPLEPAQQANAEARVAATLKCGGWKRPRSLEIRVHPGCWFFPPGGIKAAVTGWPGHVGRDTRSVGHEVAQQAQGGPHAHTEERMRCDSAGPPPFPFVCEPKPPRRP